MKNLTIRRSRISTTWKSIIGLTVLFFVLKSLGHR